MCRDYDNLASSSSITGSCEDIDDDRSESSGMLEYKPPRGMRIVRTRKELFYNAHESTIIVDPMSYPSQVFA
ncbi:hypothetical protein GYMLUDRAFT_251691 [Collybiopsis luxurians FD-317 M1]|uniref:Uncharacterized protein n=1 Tax=Collybiopsis luxurians FD-317 M1 TaxID=944289 RepID=A0A0D0BBU0_9AGAR|nr:hypothetical protein GYMLUDRAFT_251691 [Collybiopsis luxurians FD-317 M1]